VSNHGPKRSGFSLLEILLALAILGGALAVLSRIADTGMMAARESRDLAAARILCQTKLTELLLDAQAGISPQSVTGAPFDAPFDSQSSTVFQYSVEVQPAPMDGLLAIRVLVEALDSDVGTTRTRYALTRWMIDPTLGLEEAEAEEEALREEQAALAAGGGT
jgi:prepilin-type N-terminal cleavage/methylation domain-containing protein